MIEAGKPSPESSQRAGPGDGGLARLAQDLGTARDLRSVFRALRVYCEELTGSSALFVSLLDAERRQRHCVYAWADGEEVDPATLPPLELTGSPHSRAILTGEAVVVENLQAVMATLPNVPVGYDRDPRPPQVSIALPLAVLGRVIGGFEIQIIEHADPWGCIPALRVAANLAAAATDNVRMVAEERELRLAAEVSERRYRDAHEAERRAREEAEAALTERKRAELALRREQEFSRDLIDSSMDGIVAFDLACRYTAWNPTMERIFGMPKEAVLGRPAFEVSPFLRQTGEERFFLDALAGTTVVAADRPYAVPETGRAGFFEAQYAPIRDEAGTVVGGLAIVRDVTERKRAEQRRAVQFGVTSVLADSATLDTAIPRILEAIGEGFHWSFGAFWSVDQRSAVLRCKVIWRAPDITAEEFVASSRQTSLPRGVGLPGQVWKSRQPVALTDSLQDDNFPRREAAAAAGLRGAFAFPVEGSNDLLGVIEFFTHEVRPPDLDLILTVTAIGQQIGQYVERERAEEAVRESEARKRATLEAALDCVISMDHEGKIIEFNPAAERTFGYDRHEVLGQELAVLVIPPSSRAAHRSGLAGYLATGEGPVLGKRLELSALRADGAQFPVELSIIRLPTEGAPVFTGFLRDITERKRAEQEIRALNTGLEQRVQERTAQLEAALAERQRAAEALERLRRQNELILTSAGEGIYGVDRQEQATFVNPVAAALTGHDIPQLLGQSLHEVLRHSGPDGTSYERAACPLCAVLRDGSVRRGADEVFWRQDGTSFPVQFTSTPIWEQDAIAGAVVTFQDITERRGVEKLKDEFVSELHQRSQELAMLLAVSRSVASTLEMRPLLDTVFDALGSALDYSAVAVLALNETGDTLTVAQARGPTSYTSQEVRRICYAVADLGPVWDRLRQEEPIVIPDLHGGSSEAGIFRRLMGDDLFDNVYAFVCSLMCVPLVVRQQIIGILAITNATPTAFSMRDATLALGIARQAAVAIENARLHERARQAAILEERQRLARDLHDSVTQALYGISLYAEAAARALADGETEPVATNLREVRETTREALGEMRLLIYELRPPLLEEYGLAAALRARLKAVETRAGLVTDFESDDQERLAPEMEHELYRLAQEALNNVLKHAHAQRVRVRLAIVTDRTTLEVADDGVGFEPSSRGAEGFGLPGMRERAERLGGTLQVESSPGAGTCLRVEIPR